MTDRADQAREWYRNMVPTPDSEMRTLLAAAEFVASETVSGVRDLLMSAAPDLWRALLALQGALPRRRARFWAMDPDPTGTWCVFDAQAPTPDRPGSYCIVADNLTEAMAEHLAALLNANPPP